MKRAIYLLGMVAIIVLAAFTPASETLNIGESSKALAIKVETLDGKTSVLREYMKPSGLLVVFSCNTCPFVINWEDRYNELDALCKKNNIGMVLVNSNEAKRNGDDSSENMKKHAKDLAYTRPYVIDKNHKVADELGAKTTPHVFLFDQNLKLAYKGAIDDNNKDKNAVKETYLKDALTALGNAQEIKLKETKALGCSIKRVKS